MNRTFYPVGQGGFFLERVNGHQIVYDCGSVTFSNNISRCVNEAFTTNRDIDAIFISHFDADHINGLEEIFSICTVKHIFIPLVSDEEKIIQLLKYVELKSKWISKFIVDPKSIVGANTKVTYVKSANENDLETEEFELSKINKISIESGTTIKIIGATEWYYIPYNFEFIDRSIEFKDCVSRSSLSGLSLSDIYDVIKNNSSELTELKNIYKSIGANSRSENINENSLVVYSGPKIKSYRVKLNEGSIYSSSSKSNVFENIEPGCIYMGDYNLKRYFDEFNNKFQHLYENVGVVQIPHHGSKHSYNTRILNISSDVIFVISAGYHKYNWHPHKDVIFELIFNNRSFSIVSNDYDSKLVFKTAP